jgi:signal transduction histidine kinase
MKNNIRVFRAQKEFTENAAHETQTPLAAIKNQVDLLAQDNKLTKNQADIIGRMEKNVLRLSHLNRNLLLLAKIDNEQFALEEKVNLDAVIKEVLMVFDEEIALKNIGLNVQGDTRQFIISNAFLLQLLFSNLIKNAVKYNVADGFIAIELNESCFKITNSGKNQTLPREDIFKRFYKTGESNDSTGLGLAIAKRICELLKFDLHYDYEETGRHCFTVIFSKAELMSFK